MSGRDTLRRSPRDLPFTLQHDNLLQINHNEDIIITTTNDAGLLVLDTTQTSNNYTTTPGSDILNEISNHNHKSSSDSLLSYSDVKVSDETSFFFRKSVLYKTIKAYVIKIITPQDEFEDKIYTLFNRQGKTEEITAEIITASKLIRTNMSTTTSIPDNIPIIAPMPSLKKSQSIQSDSKSTIPTIQTHISKMFRITEQRIAQLEA